MSVGFDVRKVYLSGLRCCCRVWSAMSRLRYLCRDPYILLNLVSVHSKNRQNISKQTVCLLSDSRLVVGRFVDFAKAKSKSNRSIGEDDGLNARHGLK